MAYLKAHIHVTRDDVVQGCTGSRTSIQNYMSQLRKEGVLIYCGRKDRKSIYTIHDDQSITRLTAQKRDGFEAAIWRSIRIMGSFTPNDLHAVLVGTDYEFEVSEIQNYCSLLVRSKYLTVLRKANKTLSARYKLTNDTGPLPPVEKRARVVIDQNKERVVYAGGVPV